MSQAIEALLVDIQTKLKMIEAQSCTPPLKVLAGLSLASVEELAELLRKPS
jgi:hypothetical protein